MDIDSLRYYYNKVLHSWLITAQTTFLYVNISFDYFFEI